MEQEVLILSRIYNRLSQDEKKLDEEKSAAFRINDLKGGKAQPDSRQFEQDLMNAEKGGLTQEEASAVRDAYYRADDLPKETGDQVKALIHQDVKTANEASGRGDAAAWDDVPAKAESSLRAGILRETPKGSAMDDIFEKHGIAVSDRSGRQMPEETIKTLRSMYQESEKRMMKVRDWKDRRIVARMEDKDLSREEARDIISRNIRQLAGQVGKSQKPATVQLDNAAITVRPVTMKDGRKAVSLLVNGTPVSLKGAVDKIMAAVPGLREARIAVRVVQKIYQSFKNAQQSLDRGVEAR